MRGALENLLLVVGCLVVSAIKSIFWEFAWTDCLSIYFRKITQMIVKNKRWVRPSALIGVSSLLLLWFIVVIFLMIFVSYPLIDVVLSRAPYIFSTFVDIFLYLGQSLKIYGFKCILRSFYQVTV